ncbi:Uncharacterised protein [Mycobacterium tuberculosis]|nr:Uncharacterised protein [Mycobacterium tuberculosis]
MVFAVSGASRLGSARACRSGGNAASSALPLAQQYSGNDSPTALTARSRCGGTTWSTTSARSPSRIDKSTVSSSSRDNSVKNGCISVTTPSRTVVAIRVISGPSR